MMRDFRKCNFLLESSDLIKSLGYLSEILAYFDQFYHDPSLIILRSGDHGCQLRKKIKFHPVSY